MRVKIKKRLDLINMCKQLINGSFAQKIGYVINIMSGVKKLQWLPSDIVSYLRMLVFIQNKHFSLVYAGLSNDAITGVMNCI